MANRTMVILSPTKLGAASDIEKFSTILSVKQIMELIKKAESRMEIRAIGGGDGKKMQMLQIEMAGQCD
jgi:hypothetical protein